MLKPFQAPVFEASVQLPAAGTPGWSLDTSVHAMVKFPLEKLDFLKLIPKISGMSSVCHIQYLL